MARGYRPRTLCWVVAPVQAYWRAEEDNAVCLIMTEVITLSLSYFLLYTRIQMCVHIFTYILSKEISQCLTI